MTPTMRPVPTMHPSRFPTGFRGDGGTTSATGLPKRVARIGLRVLRTFFENPEAVGFKLGDGDFLHNSFIPWSMTMVNSPPSKS